jgi:hypothetical protein
LARILRRLVGLAEGDGGRGVLWLGRYSEGLACGGEAIKVGRLGDALEERRVMLMIEGWRVIQCSEHDVRGHAEEVLC